MSNDSVTSIAHRSMQLDRNLLQSAHEIQSICHKAETYHEQVDSIKSILFDIFKCCSFIFSNEGAIW